MNRNIMRLAPPNSARSSRRGPLVARRFRASCFAMHVSEQWQREPAARLNA
jgi:hypothetical protein